MNKKKSKNNLTLNDKNRKFDQSESLLIQALLLHKAGRLLEAKDQYNEVLGLNPSDVNGLQLLGTLEAQLGGHDQAISLFERALKIIGKSALVSNNLGNSLFAQGDISAAISHYDQAILIQPDYADAYLNRGNAFKELSLYEKAIENYESATNIRPNFPEALFNTGVVRQTMGQFDIAIRYYNEVIRIQPDHSSAYHNMAMIHVIIGNHNEALSLFNEALRTNPKNLSALCNLGDLLCSMGQFEAALLVLNQALILKPCHVNALINRGNVHAFTSQLETALNDFQEAINIQPNNFKAINNKGNVLKELGRLDEALACFGKAIKIFPDFAEAHNNNGVVLHEMKRFDMALECFDLATEIQPTYADALWNKSLLYLQTGQFAAGWSLYEWRKLKTDMKHAYRLGNELIHTSQEDIEGKTVLIYFEQGLGDSIQFSRYLPMIHALGAKLIFKVQKPLVEVMASMRIPMTVVSDENELPHFDLQCPLMSLPLVFKSSLDTVPQVVPYLHSNQFKAALWKERLSHCRRFRVGLVWNGGFRQDRPQLWRLNERRNISLQIFAEYFQHADIDFFSLQKGNPAENEILSKEIDFWPRGNFYNFALDLKDFSDTAALIEQLDLVISVDTSTAHLAGALGKPVWLLSRYDNCWRWLEERSDSPWYPTMKIFRQDATRDWHHVLQRVSEFLKVEVSKSSTIVP